MAKPPGVLGTRRRARLAFSLALIVLAGFAASSSTFAATGETDGIFSDALTPTTAVDTDRRGVELGVKFDTNRSGVITHIQFYRSPRQHESYQGSVWSSAGVRLGGALFPATDRGGWQTARLDHPVRVTAGESLVASYYAPRGKYSVSENALDAGYSRNGFRVPPGGGLFAYGDGGFPTGTYSGSNYLVDIVFRAGAPTPQPSTTASPEPTPDPTSEMPTQSPSPTASPTSVPSPRPTTTEAPPAGDRPDLELPRIPWEGGSGYWQRFPNARQWTDPSFFPIGVWWGNVSSDSEAKWDSAHGINFYAGMWEGTDFAMLERNGLYWVGGKLNDTFKEDSPNWPGVFMDDEVDGWASSPAAGFAHLQGIKDGWKDSGKFLYANFTSMVIGPDMGIQDQERYVNGFADAVSVDTYWYTAPYCEFDPYRGDLLAVGVPFESCHSSSSYGKTVEGLSSRAASDGERQPIWNFIELLNPTPSEYNYSLTIAPEQIAGAAMNSVIHEARGLIYFNQSFGGPCPSGMAIRDAQTQGPAFCGSAQIRAMGDVNNFIRSLAPVINTQSYEWSFGAGLETMLKVYKKDAYILAMPADGGAGSRTFVLPDDIDGKRVTVVGENRTLAVSDGRFMDSFDSESTYHVYRISLEG